VFVEFLMQPIVVKAVVPISATISILSEIDPADDGEHDRYGLSGDFCDQSRGERHTRFALVEDQHGPRALTDDEVAFPELNSIFGG
jgi:hypothetical protein